VAAALHGWQEFLLAALQGSHSFERAADSQDEGLQLGGGVAPRPLGIVAGPRPGNVRRVPRRYVDVKLRTLATQKLR
jgi:hypothetical protein